MVPNVTRANSMRPFFLQMARDGFFFKNIGRAMSAAIKFLKNDFWNVGTSPESLTKKLISAKKNADSSMHMIAFVWLLNAGFKLVPEFESEFGFKLAPEFKFELSTEV